jgi:hypothetical protein
MNPTRDGDNVVVISTCAGPKSPPSRITRECRIIQFQVSNQAMYACAHSGQNHSSGVSIPRTSIVLLEASSSARLKIAANKSTVRMRQVELRKEFNMTALFTLFGIDISSADAAAVVSAVAAVYAAYYAYMQGKDDDARRQKRTSIDLAEEWCRTEAPSPISIMRECLRNLDEPRLTELLNANTFKVNERYCDEIQAFFSEIFMKNRQRKFSDENGEITIKEEESEVLRNYFARRLNFLEVVAAAFNSGLADQKLVVQFFGGIILKNCSYTTAVNIDSTAWPELAKFIKANKSG